MTFISSQKCMGKKLAYKEIKYFKTHIKSLFIYIYILILALLRENFFFLQISGVEKATSVTLTFHNSDG